MKPNNYQVAAIILAAGSGSRMHSDTTKQRMSILGESLLHRSVRAFAESENIDSIVVVCRSDELDWARAEISDIDKPCKVTVGGESRAESAKLGFEAVENADYVAIHDAARCLVTKEIIDSVLSAAVATGAATASTPLTDTLKRVDGDLRITETIPRNSLYLAATPQIFSTLLYKKAL